MVSFSEHILDVRVYITWTQHGSTTTWPTAVVVVFVRIIAAIIISVADILSIDANAIGGRGLPRHVLGSTFKSVCLTTRYGVVES